MQLRATAENIADETTQRACNNGDDESSRIKHIHHLPGAANGCVYEVSNARTGPLITISRSLGVLFGPAVLIAGQTPAQPEVGMQR